MISYVPRAWSDLNPTKSSSSNLSHKISKELRMYKYPARISGLKDDFADDVDKDPTA